MSLSSILCWFRNGHGELANIVVRETTWLAGAAPVLGALPPGAALAVRPIDPCAGYLAVAIVAEELAGKAAVNGTPLEVGTHCLRHADRLELNGNPYWIGAHCLVEAVSYDLAVHGENQYCFITKAPLAPGQEIVLCPGTPDHRCAQIYAKSSWDRIMQGPNKMRCARCGFHPEAASWRPSEPPPTRNIDALLRSIALPA